jgi:hypothetical protein
MGLGLEGKRILVTGAPEPMDPAWPGPSPHRRAAAGWQNGRVRTPPSAQAEAHA